MIYFALRGPHIFLIFKIVQEVSFTLILIDFNFSIGPKQHQRNVNSVANVA